jgi:hypothetical protein
MLSHDYVLATYFVSFQTLEIALRISIQSSPTGIGLVKVDGMASNLADSIPTKLVCCMLQSLAVGHYCLNKHKYNLSVSSYGNEPSKKEDFGS